MSFNIYSPRPSTVLFIDETYLKNHTELDDNIDPKLIVTSIQYCQDKYILPLLGNNLFEKWKQEIASGVTLSGNAAVFINPNDLYLLETWVQPCLVAACMIELVYKITWQFRNKGVLQAKSEFSNNISTKELNWLSENYRETAAFYAQRATQFLSSNPDVYQNWLNPQLGTSGNGADLFYPQKTKYNCGLFLPGMSSNSASATAGEFVGYGMSINQRIEYLGGE